MVVDATTGRAVPGARWTSRALPKPPNAADGAPVEAETVPPSFAAGTGAVLAPEGFNVSDLRLDLGHVPVGWCDVGLDAGELVVSRYAASVFVVWPVVPEADVVVEFTVGGAAPPAWMGFGDVSIDATVAGERCDASAEPVLRGVRVHGVPALRGAPVHVEANVWSDDGGRQGAVEGVIGSDACLPLRWTIDLHVTASNEMLCGGCWSCGGSRCGGSFRRQPAWTGKTG